MISVDNPVALFGAVCWLTLFVVECARFDRLAVAKWWFVARTGLIALLLFGLAGPFVWQA